jgi:hypothetical protein
MAGFDDRGYGVSGRCPSASVMIALVLRRIPFIDSFLRDVVP